MVHFVSSLPYVWTQYLLKSIFWFFNSITRGELSATLAVGNIVPWGKNDLSLWIFLQPFTRRWFIQWPLKDRITAGSGMMWDEAGVISPCASAVHSQPCDSPFWAPCRQHLLLPQNITGGEWDKAELVKDEISPHSCTDLHVEKRSREYVLYKNS